MKYMKLIGSYENNHLQALKREEEAQAIWCFTLKLQNKFQLVNRNYYVIHIQNTDSDNTEANSLNDRLGIFKKKNFIIEISKQTIN